jgi:outer membrane protein TolC
LLINGQWEAQKNDFDFSSGDFNQSWFSGLTLSVPVFDGFRTGAKVAQSHADLRRAELLHQQIERSIHLSVLQAQQQCQEAQLRKNAQIQTVDLARRGLSIAESRYANGVGTQLELIDAQLSLQRAEADLAIAQRDLAVALVQLEYRVGILGEDLTSTQQEMP